MNVLGVIGLLIAILVGLVFAFIKKVRIVGVALLACGIAFGAWQWRREARWSRGFATVRDGSSQDLIHATLGSPTFSTDSAKSPFGYSLHDHDKRVKKELWYVSFFFPEQFTLGLDDGGVLIARYHYASP